MTRQPVRSARPAGGRATGSTLAALVPTRADVPPLPFLVVAWMVQDGSPASRFAHALYGGQDLSDAYAVRFPDGVLALFLTDATSGVPAGSTRPALWAGTLAAVPAVAPLGALDAPCSAASSFVQKAIEAVANALTVKATGNGFTSFLAASVDAVTGKLAELTDVQSQVQVPVSYHLVKPSCTKGKITAGTYTGPIDSGLGNASVTGQVSAAVRVVVAADGGLDGTIEAQTQVNSTLGHESSVEQLSISGTTSRPVVTLVRRT